MGTQLPVTQVYPAGQALTTQEGACWQIPSRQSCPAGQVMSAHLDSSDVPGQPASAAAERITNIAPAPNRVPALKEESISFPPGLIIV